MEFAAKGEFPQMFKGKCCISADVDVDLMRAGRSGGPPRPDRPLVMTGISCERVRVRNGANGEFLTKPNYKVSEKNGSFNRIFFRFLISDFVAVLYTVY